MSLHYGEVRLSDVERADNCVLAICRDNAERLPECSTYLIRKVDNYPLILIGIEICLFFYTSILIEIVALI